MDIIHERWNIDQSIGQCSISRGCVRGRSSMSPTTSQLRIRMSANLSNDLISFIRNRYWASNQSIGPCSIRERCDGLRPSMSPTTSQVQSSWISQNQNDLISFISESILGFDQIQYRSGEGAWRNVKAHNFTRFIRMSATFQTTWYHSYELKIASTNIGQCSIRRGAAGAGSEAPTTSQVLIDVGKPFQNDLISFIWIDIGFDRVDWTMFDPGEGAYGSGRACHPQLRQTGLNTSANLSNDLISFIWIDISFGPADWGHVRPEA
jgi:hypothetical protein